jgi:aldose 1-epimerase
MSESASVRVLASGEQVKLTSGRLRLTVVTVGGGLRELTCDGWAVLDGYGPDEVALGAYGQALIPWPNRLADGVYEFEGNRYQLPLTEPDKHNAIHGFARWLPWNVEKREPSRAVLTLLLYPRAGYPFALHIAIEYTLSSSGVTVRTTARNVGRSALPYANGFHPYISVGTPAVDRCRLRIAAASWLPIDDQGIPTGRKHVEGSEYDFRTAREIGATRLDTGYADLIRDEDGMARIELESPDHSRMVSVWMDHSYRYVMAFSGDSLPDAARRRRALGVEPMSAAPNAFQSGEGLRTLRSGEAWSTTWGITVK